jgi:hypothetical protein
MQPGQPGPEDVAPTIQWPPCAWQRDHILTPRAVPVHCMCSSTRLSHQSQQLPCVVSATPVTCKHPSPTEAHTLVIANV